MIQYVTRVGMCEQKVIKDFDIWVKTLHSYSVPGDAIVLPAGTLHQVHKVTCSTWLLEPEGTCPELNIDQRRQKEENDLSFEVLYWENSFSVSLVRPI